MKRGVFSVLSAVAFLWISAAQAKEPKTVTCPPYLIVTGATVALSGDWHYDGLNGSMLLPFSKIALALDKSKVYCEYGKITAVNGSVRSITIDAKTGVKPNPNNDCNINDRVVSCSPAK